LLTQIRRKKVLAAALRRSEKNFMHGRKEGSQGGAAPNHVSFVSSNE